MAFDYVARVYTVPAPERPTYGGPRLRPRLGALCGTRISLESMGNISPYVTDFVKYASNLPRRCTWAFIL